MQGGRAERSEHVRPCVQIAPGPCNEPPSDNDAVSEPAGTSKLASVEAITI